MLDDHPVIKYIGVGILGISIVAGGVEVYEFLNNLGKSNLTLHNEIRSRAEEEKKSDADWLNIDKDQYENLHTALVNVSRELATQTVALNSIRTAMRDNHAYLERRFEELENEHKRVIDSINRESGNMGYRLGVHRAEHDRTKTVLERLESYLFLLEEEDRRTKLPN